MGVMSAEAGASPAPQVPAVLSQEQVKHLEFIQAVVARLGNNSFLVKGWALTLAGALLAFAADGSSWAVATTALLPLAAFWFLDGYFLQQERLFRKLYDAARRPASTVELFSMDLRPYLPATLWRDATFSRTLWLFYGGLVCADLAVLLATAIG